MYIELTCLSCQKHFLIPFGKNELSVEKCPNCGIAISHTDNERFYAITETIYINTNRLDGVVINGIFADSKEYETTAVETGNVFISDISNLKELFNNASLEVRQRISSLMDTLYLLVYHDAQDEKLAELDETEENLRSLLFAKIDAKNEEMTQLLFGTEKDTTNS